MVYPIRSVNHRIHLAGKWPNINFAVLTLQDFRSMIVHFLIPCMNGFTLNAPANTNTFRIISRHFVMTYLFKLCIHVYMWKANSTASMAIRKMIQTRNNITDIIPRSSSDQFLRWYTEFGLNIIWAHITMSVIILKSNFTNAALSSWGLHLNFAYNVNANLSESIILKETFQKLLSLKIK